MNTPPQLDPSAQSSLPPPAANPNHLLGRLLRNPASLMSADSDGSPTVRLLAVTLVGALVYGLVVGSFARGSLMWIVPLKLVGGLFASAAICTPSLYVFSILGGADVRPRQLIRMVAGLLAISTLLLLSFAPVAWVFSESSSSAGFVGFLHWVLWIVSAAFGLRLLRTCSRALGATNTLSLVAWCGIFLLVVFQMATALRPWLGKSPTTLASEKLFFMSHWGRVIDEPSPAPAKPER